MTPSSSAIFIISDFFFSISSCLVNIPMFLSLINLLISSNK
nr:MAG TPA: hypothetical protein [Caudoviricetes sp.]